MDNERHAIETFKKAPQGYVLAFNGEPIKKSCETCAYIYDDSDSYQPAWWCCDWNNGEHSIDCLPTFPFKNGCKHFELHHVYTVDWDLEAREMDAERDICQYLSNGWCFKFNPECESAIPQERGYPACEKVI